MTLNVNLLLCRQCYAYCDHTVKVKHLELRSFHYEVVLNLSYQQI